jgi:immune inhibitor A
LNNNREILFLAIAIIVLLVACLCCGLFFTGGFFILNRNTSQSISPSDTLAPSQSTTPQPSLTETIQPSLTPTEIPSLSATIPSSPTSITLLDQPQTLQILQNVEVPINDPILVAERLQGQELAASATASTPVLAKVGDEEAFWVSNQDNNAYFQVTATLRYSGQYLDFWIENGVSFDLNTLKRLVDTFDGSIYPTNHNFFGNEWTPGIDNDPHLYVLYVRKLGNVTAGYFSSQDEYPKDIFKYSNMHEMFDINADLVALSDTYLYSTMAHEFQHMIHWNIDRNEDLWLNEGFSVLAQFINGFTVGGFDYSYTLNPETQLNDWSLEQEDNAPHYGAAFLYLDYLLSRFGSEVTQAIVNSPLNGFESINSVMQTLEIKNPQTGKPYSAVDIFGDWAVANFLQDSRIGYGQYYYQNYPNAPKTRLTESYKACPFSRLDGQVNQFGVEYIGISCQGNFTLNFSGSTSVPLVPVQAYSGAYDFWSNIGDQSDMTLTRTFDLSGVNDPVTLSYQVWYDLEEDYDYAYLEASVDGLTWQILNTSYCSTENPSGNNYGCGYTGSSRGWKQESVDLTAFTGKVVQLRFEYLTDAALNGDGLLLDDISIPQIQYFTDFEGDDGGWIAEGFARVQNNLPQTFKISLIEEGSSTTVQTIELDANQSVSIPISIGGDVHDVVLVISGTTLFTRQAATFQLVVSDQP